jgi:anti-anti-sigma factor
VVRARRRSQPGACASTPAAPDVQLLRGRDVAVTCRDRARRSAAEDEPAPRLLAGGGDGPEARTLQVAVGAHLDAGCASDIRTLVDEALRRSPEVLVLRLDEVERFDAAGVGLLLRLHVQASRQGIDLLCSDPPHQLVAVLHRIRTVQVHTVRDTG